VAKYYLIPKSAIRAVPALGRLAQLLEAWFLGTCFWILGKLSPERASMIAAAVFRLFGPRSNKAKSVRRNLAVAFPELSEKELQDTCREVFGQLGMATVELIKMRQIWAERDARLPFQIDPLAEAHFASGKPTVFVTAHVGAWQLTNLISLYRDLTITTVYAAETNPVMQEMFYQLREAFGVKLLASEEGVRPLLKELTAGNSIGLAMDNRLDTGEPIPFFGVPARTNITAARLALRSGAALIPIRAERLRPGYFKVTVHAPISSADPEASTHDQAVSMTQQINAQFEQWIRETPQQWMCLKRRWPKPGKP
jgi:KDO2-lipid IV(A) lauroyltransferase